MEAEGEAEEEGEEQGAKESLLARRREVASTDCCSSGTCLRSAASLSSTGPLTSPAAAIDVAAAPVDPSGTPCTYTNSPALLSPWPIWAEGRRKKSNKSFQFFFGLFSTSAERSGFSRHHPRRLRATDGGSQRWVGVALFLLLLRVFCFVVHAELCVCVEL